MGIKEILAKVKAGTALDDSEKAELNGLDLDKIANDAAAAARRRAEQAAEAVKAEAEKIKADLAEAQRKLAEASSGSQTESQKHIAEMKALQAKVEALEKRNVEAEQKSAQLTRRQQLADIRAKAGIGFAPDFDHTIAISAFEGALADVADLGDEAVVKERVAQFVQKNKAIVVNDTGHGKGGQMGSGGVVTPQSEGEPEAATQTAAQRADSLGKNPKLKKV